jgi:hypothetical protein
MLQNGVVIPPFFQLIQSEKGRRARAHAYMRGWGCVCVCVCVCARARACVYTRTRIYFAKYQINSALYMRKSLRA